MYISFTFILTEKQLRFEWLLTAGCWLNLSSKCGLLPGATTTTTEHKRKIHSLVSCLCQTQFIYLFQFMSLSNATEDDSVFTTKRNNNNNVILFYCLSKFNFICSGETTTTADEEEKTSRKCNSHIHTNTQRIVIILIVKREKKVRE